MSFEEQDIEAQIIEKLERIEGSLKSFLAGLEEPLEEKGGTRPVHAPAKGTLVWLKSDGRFVGWHHEIALIKQGRTLDESIPVHPPIDGTLRIIVRGGWVDRGTTIAKIVPSALV